MTVISLIPCLSLGFLGLALVPDYFPSLAKAVRTAGTTALAAAIVLVGLIANPAGAVALAEDPYDVELEEADWFTE
jgi:hypothetical protein